jgi:hypothetical protein
MRAVPISAFAALLAGMLAWLATASAQTEPRQDRNAQAVNIVLHSAQVNANRPDGKPWRSGDRKPDIVVKIKNLSQPTLREFRSQELHNVLSGAWTDGPPSGPTLGTSCSLTWWTTAWFTLPCSATRK